MESIKPSINSKVSITKISWGRKTEASSRRTIVCLCMIVGCPVLVLLNWTALKHYNGALLDTVQAVFAQGPARFILRNLPNIISVEAFTGYAAWLLLEALLYSFLPGRIIQGQRTPGGHLLSYKVNGVAAWSLTHILFLTASVLGFLDPAIIAKHWEELLVVANTWGLTLALFCQIKGYYFPSHPEDRKLSGSWAYDFWAGVELNPRIGSFFDIKFFHNSRIGMIAWTLVDLSWAAYQYQMIGEVTDSMLILLILHTTYVVDFFFNEDWYTRTIDISHDHQGFMLSWGISTFLPTFYTLQAQYLALYPTQLTRLQSCSILGLGFLGYAIFRNANSQKDLVRTLRDKAQIWGKKATFIECRYTTTDGKEHSTILLTSGWWGVSKHFNYVGDLLQCFAFCATCGFDRVLPWSYFFFMIILLIHRTKRDERRCQSKYGEKWDEYCRVVRYRLVPGVW